MGTEVRAKLTRRELVRAGMISGGVLLTGLDKIAWPKSSLSRQNDPFAGGKQFGVVDFVHQGFVQMDAAFGAELDGRLFTDLSTLAAQNPVTPVERFYIRTRASQLLPDPKSWQVAVDGLVEQPSILPIENLQRAAKPIGLHLMECAGNVPIMRFGMLSVANWAGVPLSEILDGAKVKSEATRVLISGFDRYVSESVSSIAGASWVFTLEELKAARAFLVTEMNNQPLSKDHGAPVRLLVPGWYGCTCIKWVNSIALVDDKAEATSQMQEYASRTLQKGVPRLARDYQPAVVDQAAMPIRVEKWLVEGKITYRVVGIAWGGSRPVKVLVIRFNPDEDYVPVESFNQFKNDPWTLWTHDWSPKAPGTYSIRLAVKDPSVQSRRLDSGYYVRSVEITEV
jgi:DMSO/TMAO reductase YedYZ molybdopterin-dependent catalytic subunit